MANNIQKSQTYEYSLVIRILKEPLIYRYMCAYMVNVWYDVQNNKYVYVCVV